MELASLEKNMIHFLVFFFVKNLTLLYPIFNLVVTNTTSLDMVEKWGVE